MPITEIDKLMRLGGRQSFDGRTADGRRINGGNIDGLIADHLSQPAWTGSTVFGEVVRNGAKIHLAAEPSLIKQSREEEKK